MGPLLAMIEIPRQVVFTGLVTGLAYGVLAVGLVLVYRSTKIINFAHGQVGAFAASLLLLLVVNWDVNFFVALGAVAAVAATLGASIELGVVRRLGKSPRVVILVATLGVAQLLLAAQLFLPDLERFGRYPTPWRTRFDVVGLSVRGEHLLVLIVVPVLTGLLAFTLNRTRVGTAIRAAASNADAARLSAINVGNMSTIVWTLAGILAAVTAVLIAPLQNTTGAVSTALGPALLVRGLSAALIARMRSLPVALAAGAAVGIVEAVFFFNAPQDPGRIEGLLFVIVIVAVLRMGRTSVADDDDSGQFFSPRPRPLPVVLHDVRWVRRLTRLGGPSIVVVALVLPVLMSAPSQQQLLARILLFAVIGLSLTVLTGWTGQLSLGQFAFAGIGALLTTSLVRGMNITVGETIFHVSPMAFEVAVAGATIASTALAVAVGLPALRIRGLMLAVTTLALAVMSSSWLFTRPFLTEGESILFLPRARWGDNVSLQSQRAYYYLCLAILVLVTIMLRRFRASGVGRSMIAVRDNERAAAAFTVSPTRTKLVAFGMSGAIAGLAGSVLAGLLTQFNVAAFSPEESLRVLSIAVIGGLAAIEGPILGAIWVLGLPALLGDQPEIRLLTSGAGLLVLLLYIPGGLVSVLYWIRDSVADLIAARVSTTAVPDPTKPTPATETTTARPRPTSMGSHREPEQADTPSLSTDDVRVAFGGRKAVDGVSIDVAPGEIVGLVGTNGAGKSTLMDAIGGFNSSAGTVSLFGTNVSALSPARRASLGLGRSFQGAELFPDLTVRETLLVALESRSRTPLVGTALALPRGRRDARAKQSAADEFLGFLGLGNFADRTAAELSTGTRRVVELACLLAMDARLLCLDEPTGGVAQRETEALAPLLLEVRSELRASMLVIEHDMPFIMGISDRVICLEAGRVIAEGGPDAVRNDPRVIASYLGTDDRAIDRSDVR